MDNSTISNVGITLPEDFKFSSGIGYIAIPSDLEREKYILDCYRNFRVSIHTAHDGFMNRVQISEDDLNYIEFPDSYKKLGTPVYYIVDPINNQPYIIKRFSNIKKLGNGKENQFKMGRVFGDSFVEISGDPQSGFLTLAVSSESDNAQMNLVVNNKNGKGSLNVQVLGDTTVESTGNNKFIQNESFYTKTFDPENEDVKTEVIQQKDQVNTNTPKFYVNNGKENFVLGQKFKQFLIDFITEVSKSTTQTSLGLQPLTNAALIAKYTEKIDGFLSEIGFIDK